MGRHLASILLVACVLLAACGGGDAKEPHATPPQEAESLPAGERADGEDDETGTDVELLTRVSAALRMQQEDPYALGSGQTYAYTPALAYADLAAARHQLGLPDDAHFPGPGSRGLLASFAARPLFRFAPAFWSGWSLGPLGEVFDIRRIEVVVGTNFALSGPEADEVGPEDAIVLRTRQRFGQIARALREAGYRQHSDGLLVGDEPLPLPGDDVRFASNYRGVPFPAVGHSGEGVVVLGGSPRVVRAALREPEAELTALAELVAELPGPARVARGFGARKCVEAIGLGEQAAPREGEVRAIIDPPAQAERLLFGGVNNRWVTIDGEIRFAQPTADDDGVSSRFTSTDEFNATRLPVEDVARPYDCP